MAQSARKVFPKTSLMTSDIVQTGSSNPLQQFCDSIVEPKLLTMSEFQQHFLGRYPKIKKWCLFVFFLLYSCSILFHLVHN